MQGLMNDFDVVGVGQSGEGCEVEVFCRGVYCYMFYKVKIFIEKNKMLILYSIVYLWNIDILYLIICILVN